MEKSRNWNRTVTIFGMNFVIFPVDGIMHVLPALETNGAGGFCLIEANGLDGGCLHVYLGI